MFKSYDVNTTHNKARIWEYSNSYCDLTSVNCCAECEGIIVCCSLMCGQPQKNVQTDSQAATSLCADWFAYSHAAMYRDTLCAWCGVQTGRRTTHAGGGGGGATCSPRYYWWPWSGWTPGSTPQRPQIQWQSHGIIPTGEHSHLLVCLIIVGTESRDNTYKWT